MENIYNQTEEERNSIVELPAGFAEKSGNTLYSWLGSLWNGLHKGDMMIRGLQAARGIRLAQMYLDMLEAAKLKDRNGIPVFHKELWHPIVIRLSERDTSQENMLKIGMDGVVGEQPTGSDYGEGTVFKIGKLANFEDYVTYPIGTSVAGGALSIVDNIINPTVSIERGQDFWIRNGSIVFRRENDPFAYGSKFDKYDIPSMIDDDGVQVSDMEAVLWASDVLVDRNYIADHMSYALGASAPSTDLAKRIVNAAWSAVCSGMTPGMARTVMASMLNIPVIQHDLETVVDISQEKDGDGNIIGTMVRTDLGEYRISPKAKLRSVVKSGAVMSKGELLDESLRVYPFLNKVSAKEVVDRPGYHGYSEWVFEEGTIPDGFYIGGQITWADEWQVIFYDGDGNWYQFYSNPEYDHEDTLKIVFYSYELEDVNPIATRSIIDEDPTYRVDADAGTNFSVPLAMDIPSVTVPSSIIRARTEYGVYAMWNMAEVKKDAMGHLFFDIGGQESDVKAFWEDVWKNAEESGTVMESIMGPAGTKISPAAFFLNNLVGANTLFVVVDDSQLDDPSMMRDPMFFDMLCTVVPSGIRLFVVEHMSVGGDVADMGDAIEECPVSAALQVPADHATQAEEFVSMRFFRPPPAKVMVTEPTR